MHARILQRALLCERKEVQTQVQRRTEVALVVRERNPRHHFVPAFVLHLARRIELCSAPLRLQ
jgi:hypothetical protein